MNDTVVCTSLADVDSRLLMHLARTVGIAQNEKANIKPKYQLTDAELGNIVRSLQATPHIF